MNIAAQDIIKGALRALGVIGKSETPTADEMNDALQSLNMMIDEWSARSLMSTALTRQSFPLVARQQSYTIGPTGNFVAAVPISINSAFLRDGYGLDYPLEIMTREVFDSMADKSFVTAPPQGLFYDPGSTQQASQLGTIYVYYTPDASTTYTLYIESLQPFTEFAALTTTVTFPAAYYKALKFNLAIELAPEYGISPSKEVVFLATESVETIEAMNAVPIIAALDLPGQKGGFNIYSGDFNTNR